MRILFISANFRPSVGGIERYVEILAGALARRRHEVTVLACRMDRAAGEEVVDGVRIVRVPASNALRSRLNVPYPVPEPVTATRTLRRLLSQADVANPQDALYPTTLGALTLARARRVPAVLTQHVAFVPQHRAALDAAQRLAIRTLGRCARLAAIVVAYNPAVAEWARKTWSLDDVRLLPPGVPDAPEVDRAALRAKLGLSPDAFLGLFVGRDVPKKGLDLFVASRDPAYELLAVTDRRTSCAADGVRIIPFMEPERLRELMCCVDAFVLPSEGEGFPLSLQEALVTGLPSVVAAGPGYDRYLRDEEAVFVGRNAPEIRKALRRLATDEPFRRTLASRAREAGRREFGVDRFAEAYEGVYADAVAGRPS